MSTEESQKLLILIPVNQLNFRNIFLTKSQPIHLGRNKKFPLECCFDDKRISNLHAKISSEVSVNRDDDEKTFEIFLEDCSTNGTFLNGIKVGKSKRAQLFNNDVITLSHPTASSTGDLPAFTVKFLFENPKKRKVSETEEGENSISATLEMEITQETSSPSLTSGTTDSAFSKKAIPLVDNVKHEIHDATTSTITSNLQNNAEDLQFEQELICGICQDVLYKSISLMPCLHNFCSPCYSAWIKSQKEDLSKPASCPKCRGKVKGIGRNTTVQNLVDNFLIKHPDKKKSPEEILDLEKTNLITDEYLRTHQFVKRKKRHLYNSDGELDVSGVYDSDGEYVDDEDDDDEEDDENFDGVQSIRPRCVECITPSTVDGFQCGEYQAHVTCSAGCGQMMPRRDNLPPGRSQSCHFCHGLFCELYFGRPCLAPNETGHFRELSLHTMNQLPTNCLNSNSAERDILLNWMGKKSMSVDQLFKDICLGLESKKWKLKYQGIDVSSHDICCKACATNIFSQLIYSYREAIPKTEFPQETQIKPDCYYGNECRSQSHNVSHSLRYNHICKNTKK